MSKARKPRPKKVKKANKKPVEVQAPVEAAKAKSTITVGPWVTYLGLAVIVLFSCFLRYENFSVWQKKKNEFQYQGEYQMSNYDSYFYLRAAKDWQNGTYDDHDELRRAPDGMERTSLPPLLSLTTATISSITGIPLASVAIFMPVVLSSLLALIVFVICQKLELSSVSSLTAALFSAISMTYVARTRVGVFDTDSLTVVFPLVNSYLFYHFVQQKHIKRFLYIGLALLNTLLYVAWWNTAGSVAVLSLVVPFGVAWLFFNDAKPAIKYGVLGGVALVSLFLVKDQAIALLELVTGSKDTRFPSNMDISELDAVGLSEFTKKSLGNGFLVLLSLAGLVYFGIKHKLRGLILIFPILLAFTPFMAGNRFIAFSAPIMALGIAHVIQALFDFKDKVNPMISTIVAVFIGIIGVFSTYKTITDKFPRTAAYENMGLLDVLEKATPEGVNIWTDADLGYQVQYYLDRGTFADGEFEDGELRYYLYFPLAANNQALAANYMKFYNVQGRAGMEELYTLFPNVAETFDFLKQVLSKKPSEASTMLDQMKEQGKLPSSEKLGSTTQWLEFLYPKSEKEVYAFLYYKMSQTAAWFKQGNADLTTGETKGLPMFLVMNGLKEEGGVIQNNQIKIDTASGRALYMNGKQAFQYLRTFENGQERQVNFSQSGQRLPASSKPIDNDSRFAFHWNKRMGYGVAVSRELGETAFAELYLQGKNSTYFEPIDLKAPLYQIWKVHGDVYEK